MNVDRLDKIGIKHKIILFMVAVIAALWLFGIFIFLPQQARRAELAAQYRLAREKLEQLEAFALAHPDADRYLAELGAKLGEAEKKLPNEPDVGGFLMEVERASRESGVHLLHVQPGLPANKNGYRQIPVEILVRGNYFQTLTFLNKLESAARFNSVVNMTMQSRGGSLESKLSVLIFSYGISPQPQAATKQR
ncbi:Pilus assembly protein, PilO [Sporolituus thermophilus DSM 23256]|uniref:Pilus assembly protein, PilO n=1 Tax=Sporolituus thermophilus DSM 23256 TaxID=1123285 RepID=A0A1G7I8J0_9FIRM|nr:Pilus assembly protein, PilO [Sporolituus thermophilus DSM 23256]